MTLLRTTTSLAIAGMIACTTIGIDFHSVGTAPGVSIESANAGDRNWFRTRQANVARDNTRYTQNVKRWELYDLREAKHYYRANGSVPEAFQRQIVEFKTEEKPGTIVIDGNRHFLYLVQPGFTAIRYGIGVGREGFGWAGIVHVGRKTEWPRWTPPPEMVKRDPKAAMYKDGMPGGPDNPLGPRAMYLFEGSQDTIYRIHGTNEPWSIGLNISSGCIRMNNDDIIHLFLRVAVGAKVVVLMQGAALYRGV